MKRTIKCIVAGVILLLIGGVIFIAALWHNGWNFSRDYETKSFTADGEISRLEIDIGAGELKTVFEDIEKVEIIYPVADGYETGIAEENGTLKYSAKNKWNAAFFQIFVNYETVIKIPTGSVLDLSVDMSAGTTSLAAGTYGQVALHVSAGTMRLGQFECNSFVCEVSAGTVSIDRIVSPLFDCEVSAGTVSVANLSSPDIRTKISAGTINLTVEGREDEYSIRTHVSAGSCNVSDRHSDGDKKIDVDCSAGTISVSFTG